MTEAPAGVFIVDDHAVVRSGIAAYLNVIDDLTFAGEAPDGVQALRRLTELESSLHVRDLYIDETKIHVMTDPDVVVARVAAPRLATAEEEAAEAATEDGAPAPEGAPAEAPAETEGGSE